MDASTRFSSYNNILLDDSITELINRYLQNHGYGDEYEYCRDLNFADNLRICQHTMPQNVLSEARKYAFNEKYGNYYHFRGDYRDYVPTWSKAAFQLLRKRTSSLSGKHVIGVGSNYGLELEQLFRNAKEKRECPIHRRI